MRLLITGASGLLGVNLALEAAREHTVFGTVHTHPLRMAAVPAERRFTVIQVDLLAPGALERLFEQAQPEWVIHCAALADLEACQANPSLAAQLNSELPAKLARLVARGGARLVHISTDAVFDGQRDAYTEADIPHPLGVYARTKLAGEQGVLEADPTAIVARVNLFGWSMSGKRSLAEFFYNNLSAGKGVRGFTDVYFCPLLVNDLAWILIKMLSCSLNGLYHVVSSECLSKYEFGVRLAMRFGLDETLITPSSFVDAGLKATRSPNLNLDTHKLSTAFGESLPQVSTGLERFYALYQQSYPQLLHDAGQKDPVR